MANKTFPCVLTIAGTDPSGGAGIQADIKSISATGAYAASVITALVAQNTVGVQSIADVPPHFVIEQLHSVFSDLQIDAVKIGMLHNEKIIEAIATVFDEIKPNNIVLDPVMVAKNGSSLLPVNHIDFLKKRLLPFVYLITPNIFEAEIILGKQINSTSDMKSAAKEIGNSLNINVLLKGGHLNDEYSSDILYVIDDGTYHWFHAERINTKNTHGTGCTLSSAIASYLAKGFTLRDSIAIAKEYLTDAIKAGSQLNIGHGHGPVHHFYCLAKINYRNRPFKKQLV